MDTKHIREGLIFLSISIVIAAWLYADAYRNHLPVMKYDAISISSTPFVILVDKETGILKVMKYNSYDGSMEDTFLTSPAYRELTETNKAISSRQHN